MLANCRKDEFAPGGNDFGDGGVWDAAESPRFRRSKSIALQLRISTTPAEFWPWEPIELDVNLRLVHANKSIRWKVPDTMDPGYDRFELWITEPDGTRKRFRSPRRYCAYERSLEVSVSKPCRRDISIFWNANGYTFCQPGTHAIRARWFLSKTSFIESNEHVINIRSRRGLSKRRQDEVEDLSNLLIEACSVFYRRNQFLRVRQRTLLEHLVGRFGNSHVGAAAMIVLGRSMASHSATVRTSDNQKRATRLLKRALNHNDIGSNRKKNGQLALKHLKWNQKS